MGVQFDGTDDIFAIPDHSSLDFTSTLTIAVWVFIPSWSSNTGFGIVGRDEVNGWSLAVYDDGHGTPSFRRKVTFGKLGVDDFMSTSSLTAGVWTHIAAKHDNGNKEILINGVSDNTGSGFANYDGSLTGDINIGGFATLSAAFFSNMHVSEISAWARILSNSDINEQLYTPKEKFAPRLYQPANLSLFVPFYGDVASGGSYNGVAARDLSDNAHVVTGNHGGNASGLTAMAEEILNTPRDAVYITSQEVVAGRISRYHDLSGLGGQGQMTSNPLG